MKAFHFTSARVLLGRLERGDDLAEGLTHFCVAQGVESGSLTGIGALEHGALGYYDQGSGVCSSATQTRRALTRSRGPVCAAASRLR